LNGVAGSGKSHGQQYGKNFGVGASGAMAGAGGAAATRFASSFQSNSRAERLGSAVGKTIGLAVVGAAGAATAGLGAILFKGLDRYKSLDATAKRLGAMGKTTEQIKTAMDGVTESIKGTPIALDEAANAATKFLSGNVKEGKQLNDIMTAIADASGASGQSFGDLATIFGQVMNKGKLQAEEMNQLNERGINIQSALRKQFGWTGDELTEMAGEGKITFDQLLLAVEGSFGGMAKAAGNSIDGAIGNVKTSVARLGANFLSAIFGDPLSTTEGPGAMAEAINNIGVKIDGLNTWVTAHQGEIKQFFTDAANIVGDVAGAVGDVVGFLKEYPELIAIAGGAFATYFVASKVAGLVGALGGISRDLDLLPGKADKAARGINFAFAAIVIPELGKMLNDQIQQFLADNAPGLSDANNSNTPDQLGKQFRDFLDNKFTQQDMNNAPTKSGTDALSADSFLGNTPLGNTNPTNANTGGALQPATKSVQDYIKNDLGFTGTIGGWRPPDGYNEHSSGKASDVMIRSSAEGYALLPNVLKRPGVEYIIWDQKTWFPNGASKPYTGPNPHTDHLHVKTFNTGGPVSGKPGNDQILAWLTDKEHVWTADEVAAVGGQDKMMQLRAMAQSGQLTPDAVSGMIAGPQGVDATGRTEGYIPAGAGFSGKTGGGVAGSLLAMGGEAIKGAIQTAADAGKMAAAVGSFGASAAGGPAAGMGIQMGADIAKRGVDYGVEMAGIGIGAASEILLPFGAPRWLNDVDPTSFIPKSGVTGAATTTAEQAVLDQQAQTGVDPNTAQHGTGLGAPPGPLDALGNVPTPPTEPAAEIRGGDTINLYPKDVDESFRLLEQRQKLQSMQYAGRP
jgi:tape measure domain-containing protein